MGAGYRFINKATEKSAEVFIYEDVGAGWFGGVTAKDFAADLKAAGKVDTIDVRIASYGGDVIEGLAMYRLLAEHPARIVSHIDSVAASIASIIAMAGDEIIIAEAGSLMIHEAWTIAAGNAEQIRATANQLDATSVQLAEIYAARTSNPLAKVKDWMAKETWFYGKEAVDAGFAHSVADNVRAAASASSMWRSVMQGRIAQRINLDRVGHPSQEPGAARPHPANQDIRAELSAQSERARARHLTHVN